MKRIALILGVVLAMQLSGCGVHIAAAPTPGLRCADMFAQATTSPFEPVTGVYKCIAIPGSSLTDQDIMIAWAAVPPIFDAVEKHCGYYAGQQTYVYILRNTADGKIGELDVHINPKSGEVVNAGRGYAKEATCPAANTNFGW